MMTEQEETRNRSISSPLIGELEERSKRRAAWEARCKGDASYRLNEMLLEMRSVESQLWQFIGEGHGEGCRCEFCGTLWSEDRSRSTTDGDIIEHDLRGFAYALETAIAVIGGQVTRLDPEDLEELRDQRERMENLKLLEETMAEIQEAADRDSETPHVVSARITVEV
jgi:hypothetical protein